MCFKNTACNSVDSGEPSHTYTDTYMNFKYIRKQKRKKKRKQYEIAPMNLSSTANTYKTIDNTVSLYMSTHSRPQPYYFEQTDIIFYKLIQKIFNMFPISINYSQEMHT